MFIGSGLLSRVAVLWIRIGFSADRESGSVPVSSILGQCGFRSGSRDLIIENLKNLLDEQKNHLFIFFLQKLRNIFH